MTTTPTPEHRASLPERAVQRVTSWFDGARSTRRSFLTRTAVVGAALAVNPWDFVLRPVSAYAAVCGSAASCAAGYSVFCCTVNGGSNTCPGGTFPAGWWKADNSGFCCGSARYYIDCNASCGSGWQCRCNDDPNTCDNRLVACNQFRYGQCNQQIACYGPVVCRMVSCTPPWQVGAWACTAASATDNNTVSHTAPCLPGDCPSAIETKYFELGGPSGPLGPVVKAEGPDIENYGRYAVYRNGAIYAAWGPGVHAVMGTIWTSFQAHDTIRGPLGYPVSDPWTGGRGYAECQVSTFQHGAIYANYFNGTHALWGPCYDAYFSTGSMAGPLYAPTSDTHQVGSQWQTTFSGGSITYDPATGTVTTDFQLPAASAPDQNFVRAAYADFLGRAPTDRELALAVYGLENGTLTRQSFLWTLAQTVDWVQGIVTSFYAQTLGRPPDATGLKYWTAQITSGHESVATVGARFYASDEYYHDTGGTLTAWVTDLYRKILHRTPDPGGLSYWVARAQAHGRTSIAYAFFQASESLADRVTSLYEKLLNRAPESRQAVTFWSAQILAHGDLSLAVQLAASAEFYADAQHGG